MFKSLSYGFKDVDTKQGIVTGYFAAFGNRDSDGDVIEKGAFLQSIKDHGPKSAKPRIKHLLDHNTTKAVGVIQELKEDDFGLYYESKAGRHQNGVDFLLMVEDGIVTEHSIGYNIIKYRSEVNEEKRESTWYLEELKLWEGSSLQFLGANENTPIQGVKSLELENVAERISALEKAIRNGKYSDEAFKSLEIELIAIKQYMKSLSGNKLDINEPVQAELKRSEFDLNLLVGSQETKGFNLNLLV